MNNIKPLKFLIPAGFLILLGIGNILVGNYKYNQYYELTEELNKQDIKEEPKDLSPLQKLRHASEFSPKLLALKNKAGARRDFYLLVSYSGKVFLSISIIFLISLFFINNLNQQKK